MARVGQTGTDRGGSALDAGAARALGYLLGCALALVGCQRDDEPLPGAEAAADLDYRVFESRVYPVLLRDCGFAACHGAPDRFFRVWGPGRVRLPNSDGTVPEATDQKTSTEVTNTFALAKDMVDPLVPGRSQLLRKPLAVAAGGASHQGSDAFGRDVYRTTRDNGYRVLLDWVSALEEPEPTPSPMGMGVAGAGGPVQQNGTPAGGMGQ